jgi:hypothetical protein
LYEDIENKHQRRKNVQANSLVEENARSSKQKGNSIRKRLRLLWQLKATDPGLHSPESAAGK